MSLKIFRYEVEGIGEFIKSEWQKTHNHLGAFHADNKTTSDSILEVFKRQREQFQWDQGTESEEYKDIIVTESEKKEMKQLNQQVEKQKISLNLAFSKSNKDKKDAPVNKQPQSNGFDSFNFNNFGNNSQPSQKQSAFPSANDQFDCDFSQFSAQYNKKTNNTGFQDFSSFSQFPQNSNTASQSSFINSNAPSKSMEQQPSLKDFSFPPPPQDQQQIRKQVDLLDLTEDVPQQTIPVVATGQVQVTKAVQQQNQQQQWQQQQQQQTQSVQNPSNNQWQSFQVGGTGDLNSDSNFNNSNWNSNYNNTNWSYGAPSQQQQPQQQSQQYQQNSTNLVDMFSQEIPSSQSNKASSNQINLLDL